MSSSTGTSKQKKGLRQYLGLKDSFGKSRSRSPSQSRSQPDIETPSVTTGPNEGAGSSARTSSGIPPGGDYETISHLTTPPSVGSSEPTGTTSNTPIIVEPAGTGQRTIRPSPGLEVPLKNDTPDTGTPTNLTPASGPPSEPTSVISTTPVGGESANVEAGLGLLSPEIEPGPSGRSTSGPITSASITPVQGQKIRSVAWDGLRGALQAFRSTSKIFPPLSSVIESLLSCLDGLEVAARSREDYEILASEMATLINSLNQSMVGPSLMRISDSVESAVISIESQLKEVKEKLDHGAGRGIREASTDEEELVRHYRRIEAHFRQIQINASMSMLSIVDEHLVNTRLEGLKPAKQATYDSSLSTEVNRRGCTEGTRIEVLAGLDRWLDDSSSSSIYWMNGMAGTGKTTIASTFCDRAEKRKLLGASFFCTRSSAECRASTRIVPTIAYQLARYSIPYQSALCEILGKSPDIGSKNVSKQFERLLKEPLQQVKDAMPGHLVIVIDALDECEDRQGVELTLDMLLRYAPQVPLKFLITSRPEPEIYDRLIHSTSREVIHLHDIEKSLVRADIELYLNEELAFMQTSPADIQQLVERSGTLFIYAATLVRYIRSGKRLANPQKRLKSVLDMTPEATKKNTQIDALYTAVLESALSADELEADETEDIRAVLRTVLSAQEPISVETIATLAGIDDPDRVLAALQPLRSVLHQSEETGLVSILHASFPDFMFSNERSGAYFCDIIEHSRLLALRCFEVMKNRLRFNICGLTTSFLPDEKVENLQGRIKDNVSPTLAYACRYWASHISSAPRANSLFKALDEFLCCRLLFWMEVLNLRREIAVGVDGMLTVQKWLIPPGSASSELMRLVDDAYTFVTSFAVNPISQSTPHIYISSLAFCPKSSSVSKYYSERTRGLLELKGSLMERLEGAPLAAWKIGPAVNSVAYSPDSARIAVGCNHNQVRILSSFDGVALVEPLRGHTKAVLSVAFSPDGKLLASGSMDHTIRVWNSYNGILTAGPFMGHTDFVVSVSFSPDSTRVVSSSFNGAIYIWNAYDGSILPSPSKDLSGSNRVTSVAFSPDGTLIASGSYDKTVRIWKAQDGTVAATPFEGHTAGVTCLAFTLDGTRLISGSVDKTVRVWNISSGTLATEPFEGHTQKITSLAVSPDGARVATGSEDCTIRLWSIRDGTLVAGPFIDDKGQTSSVHVAYSPDGTRLIAGSENGTIYTWNPRVETLFPEPYPYQSAIRGITSMVFCPDKIHFLASTRYGVLTIWDASDGSFQTIPGKTELLSTPLNLLSPDGSCVAGTSENGEVQVISTIDGSLVVGPFGVKRTALAGLWFSHNSKAILMGCYDGTIKVCDIRGANTTSASLKGDHRTLHSLTQSPDFSLIASYSGWSNEEAFRVWDIVTPALDLGQYTDPPAGSTMRSTYDYAALNKEWNITKNGWMVDSSERLLFWLPASLASAWCSPYAILVINKSGTLKVPKQKPLIGDEWVNCYVQA